MDVPRVIYLNLAQQQEHPNIANQVAFPEHKEGLQDENRQHQLSLWPRMLHHEHQQGLLKS